MAIRHTSHKGKTGNYDWDARAYYRGYAADSLKTDRQGLMDYLRRRNEEDQKLRPDRRDARVRRLR